jgi:hypothetical protein
MSFRGRKIPRIHDNDNQTKEQISVVENTQQLLRLLLKEVSEHNCRQMHLDN